MPLQQDLFGTNVFIFDDHMAMDTIQQTIDAIFEKQESSQFGDSRVALLFKPGHYDVHVKVGFYTSVMGLGFKPSETVIHQLSVPTKWMVGNNATCNFWRSVENVTLETLTSWAVSQAAPLRRVWVKNDLLLHNKGAASGGFMADCVIDGMVDSGPQQQWFSRNSRWSLWKGALWNMFFLGNHQGVQGNVEPFSVTTTWPTPPYAIIDQTPKHREKPFLYMQKNEWFVFVPQLQSESKGPSWIKKEQGQSLPLTQFVIVKPSKDFSVEVLNKALQEGKNILFTPGIYTLTKPLHLVQANTIILGLGYATLVASLGKEALVVDDVSGAIVAGLLIDAGKIPSNSLVRIGHPDINQVKAHPITLSDIYIRIGGTPTALPSKAKVGMTIYASHVIGDHFWIWRADHGQWTRWDENVTQNGLVVEGDYVTIYGLFVEHFHEYNTLWRGNHGAVYFYQNELPYDMPNQASWMSHQGTKKGFAAYYVDPRVTHHYASGLGIYGVFLYNQEPIVLESAIETPSGSTIDINYMTTVLIVDKGKNPPLSQGSSFLHVINEKGPTTTKVNWVQHYNKKLG